MPLSGKKMELFPEFVGAIFPTHSREVLMWSLSSCQKAMALAFGGGCFIGMLVPLLGGQDKGTLPYVDYFGEAK